MPFSIAGGHPILAVAQNGADNLDLHVKRKGWVAGCIAIVSLESQVCVACVCV